MREIKFRAWHKLLKSFVSLHKYCVISCDSIVSDDVVLMQSIGLKDRNGKEIYEGDIVRVKDKDGEKIQVIEYSEISDFGDHYGSVAGGFVIECYPNIEDNRVSIEIIGNICENSELMP